MIEAWIADWGSQIFVGVVLIVFGAAFRSWSATLKGVSDKILSKLEYLSHEFHEHRVDVEKRVTRVETQVEALLGNKEEDKRK